VRAGLIAILLCAGFLVLGLSWTFAKHKAEAPVLERFEATMIPPLDDSNDLSVDVEGFSNDAELEAFRQAFTRGGNEELLKAFQKSTKGHFKMGSGVRMPIRALQSSSGGGVRRLSCIGEAPKFSSGVDGFVPTLGGTHAYTFIQLIVDEQGKGKGTLIPFAGVIFDKDGHLQIISPKVRNIQLVNVHVVK